MEGASLIDFFKGRKSGLLPPKARQFLSQHGDERIQSIFICRTPVSISGILNALTLGKLNQLIKKLNYDDIMHLYMIIRTNTGDYGLEKNEIIEFFIPTSDKYTDCININMHGKSYTINELLNNTRKYMGKDKFTRYNAKNNNCQVFVLSILKANKIGEKDDAEFIMQNAEYIFKNLGLIPELVANFATGLAARLNALIYGQGMI